MKLSENEVPQTQLGMYLLTKTLWALPIEAGGGVFVHISNIESRTLTPKPPKHKTPEITTPLEPKE